MKQENKQCLREMFMAIFWPITFPILLFRTARKIWKNAKFATEKELNNNIIE